jgi:hypothetical protein
LGSQRVEEGVRHRVFPLVFACVISTGCTLSGDVESDRSPDTTAREPLPTPPRPGVERRIAVYSSVVRQLVLEDHTFGGVDPGFKVVYVLDGALEGAERTLLREPPPKKPFGEELKRGLRETLADLPDLVFVRDRSTVLKAGGEVRNDGVLVTLGPIEGNRRKAEVGSNLWVAGKGAIWLTYVVKPRTGGWVVTGTTGAMTVS